VSDAPTRAAGEFEQATYRKVTRRIVPFLFLCYLLAYINRVAVSFAKLQMQSDLRMSDAVYGLGAGIFFIGYFFFEIPANMMMRKLGARRWLGPIMIVWGLVSVATMYVRGASSYYAARFLLGVVESGFFPGVILYLTFWYTRTHRAKMVSAFMTAIPFSGVVAGPISGWIMGRMTGLAGLTSWQWLFVADGVPSILAGIVTLFYLPDGPVESSWLTAEEKSLVLSRLEEEESLKKEGGGGHHRIADLFRSRNVWLMCAIYFGIVMGSYGLGFWMPQLIKDAITKDPLKIGWITVIPWGFATLAMIAMGHHSDIRAERRWHIAASLFVGAGAFLASAIPGMPGWFGILALALAAAGILCANSIFWALPTGLLSGAAAAAGIAWINSVGNLAGYVSPFVVGEIRDRTHSMVLALFVLSAAALLGGAVTLYVTRTRPGAADRAR
jgi:sugar phosphate permease